MVEHERTRLLAFYLTLLHLLAMCFPKGSVFYWKRKELTFSFQSDFINTSIKLNIYIFNPHINIIVNQGKEVVILSDFHHRGIKGPQAYHWGHQKRMVIRFRRASPPLPQPLAPLPTSSSSISVQEFCWQNSCCDECICDECYIRKEATDFVSDY